MRRRALIGLGFAGGVGVLVAILAFARTAATLSDQERIFLARFEDARRVLDRLPLEKVSSDTTRAIRSVIAQSDGTTDAPLTPAQRAALADAVTAFLDSRFGPDAPSGYAARLRSDGYAIKPLEELKDHCLIESVAPKYFGAAGLPQASPEELFEQFIRANDRFAGGKWRLTKLAPSPAGISVATKILTPADPRWPPVAGTVGQALDFGGPYFISPPWSRGPIDERDLMRGEREGLVAAVGLVGELGDGTRRPIGLSLVYDPASARWYIVAAYVGSYGRGMDASVRWDF